MRASLLCGVITITGAAWMGCVGDTSPAIDASIDTTTNDVANDTGDGAASGPISGTLISIDGVALQNTKLDVGGQIVMTDINGKFTAPDPGPTYNATIVYQQGSFTGTHSYVVFRGLTRRDPTLDMPVGYLLSNATVSGTITGSSPALAGGRLAFAPKTVIGQHGTAGTAIADGGFSATSLSFPSTSQSGDLVFFQRTFDDAGIVNGYPAYAINTNVGLSASATLSEAIDAGPPQGVGLLSGSVNAPSNGGWLVAFTQLQAIFNNTTPIDLEQQTTSAFNFTAPNINGVKLQISATAQDTAGDTSTAWRTGLTVNTSGISLVLPAPPVVASPQPNATVALASTSFAYNNLQGIAYATFECETASAGIDGGPAGANYFVHVITTETSVSAPQDPLLSLALPPSGSVCAFRVASMSGFATVDGATGAGGYANSYAQVATPGPSVTIFAVVDGAFAVSAPLIVTAQ